MRINNKQGKRPFNPTEDIIKRYEEEGYYVIWLIETNKKGIPNLLCLKDGNVLFVEVRPTEYKAVPLQQYRHGELRRMGFETTVLSK